MTSDGLRTFNYDEFSRLAQVSLMKDGEAAKVTYLHNALGQRVFKSEVRVQQTLPDEEELGLGFVDWLKKNFKWLFLQASTNASVGTTYVYADGELPSWALLGEYDNGSAAGAGRSEYIWLPRPDGAIPVGMFRNGKLFAIHSDHLGTPRLMTNEQNQPVWQWPYSAFGNNKPTGVLKATPKPRQAMTIQPEMLKATSPTELNLRMPGQYHDSETGAFYNYFRQYDPRTGRYTQADPIGLEGGLNRFGYVDGNPLRSTDPEGLAPIALAVPFLGGVTVGFSDFVIGAGIAAMASSAKPPRVTDPQANMEWQAYKDKYAEPPPPNLDECELLRWKLLREKTLLAARKAWDAKWGAHHIDAIMQSQRAIRNLENKLKDAGCECP